MSLLENPSSGLAGSIHGQNPHVVDRELAQLLASTYTVAAQRRDPAVAVQPLPAGWHALDGSELLRAGIHPADLSDAKSGFDAALYRNDQGLVVLAFNGTDQGRDWRPEGLFDVHEPHRGILDHVVQPGRGEHLRIVGHRGDNLRHIPEVHVIGLKRVLAPVVNAGVRLDGEFAGSGDKTVHGGCLPWIWR